MEAVRRLLDQIRMLASLECRRGSGEACRLAEEALQRLQPPAQAHN